MDFNTISFGITVITGIASLILAIFAIWLGKASERESRTNFKNTQNTMRDYYEKTKDVLAEIDKRATVTEKTVTDSQQQLLDTVTNIVKETAVPAKPDFGEQAAAQFLQLMISDPDKATEMMNAIQKFGEMSEKPPSHRPKPGRNSGRRKT